MCLSTPIDLEDIEDLIDRKESSNESYPNERTKNRPNVVIPKVRKREKPNVSNGLNKTKEKSENDQDVFFARNSHSLR